MLKPVIDGPSSGPDQTALLGGEYRQDVFPVSRDVAGAISQVLHYRESLMQEVNALFRGQLIGITGSDPRCVVIAGSANGELTEESQQRSFERFRERLTGVILVTFDEVFERVAGLIRLLETPNMDARS